MAMMKWGLMMLTCITGQRNEDRNDEELSQFFSFVITWITYKLINENLQNSSSELMGFSL